MRKLLNKPWFVAILAIAALAFVVRSVLPNHPAHTAPASEAAPVAETESDTPSAEATSVAISSPEAIRAALKELAISATLRDPFLPRSRTSAASTVAEKVTPPDSTDSVKVSAVWIQGDAVYALINDRIVAVGDQIGRLTIESATRNGIWFRHWKGRDFVKIGDAFTLTTPADKSAVATLSSGG